MGKTKKEMRKLGLVLGLGVVLSSCVSETSVDPLQELTKKQEVEETENVEVQISDEEFYAILQAIPSPLESTSLMHGVGIPYNEDLLVSTDKSSEYNSWFAQAANLGIYGADMGYANVYGETTTSMGYMGGIRGLADKLKVGQFFDLATIQELASKKNDLEKLINASQINFQKMNDYLCKQKRGKVSAAMVIGGWIEGLYLSTTVAKMNPKSEVLQELVAEQKLSIGTIEMLISIYGKDENFVDIKKSFVELNTAFEGIKMIYHEGETTEYEDEDGNLVVEDDSSTEIIVTNEDVVKLADVALKMRENLIKLK